MVFLYKDYVTINSYFCRIPKDEVSPDYHNLGMGIRRSNQDYLRRLKMYLQLDTKHEEKLISTILDFEN